MAGGEGADKISLTSSSKSFCSCDIDVLEAALLGFSSSLKVDASTEGTVVVENRDTDGLRTEDDKCGALKFVILNVDGSGKS